MSELAAHTSEVVWRWSEVWVCMSERAVCTSDWIACRITPASVAWQNSCENNFVVRMSVGRWRTRVGMSESSVCMSEVGASMSETSRMYVGTFRIPQHAVTAGMLEFGVCM